MKNLEINDLLINDFLIQLEYLALKKEEKIDSLEKENEEYLYISSLLEVLEKSKIAFVEGYYSQSDEKKNTFKEIVSKLLVSSEKINTLLEEINNLYRLKQYELDKLEETKDQKKQSEKVLTDFIGILKSFIRSINYNQNKKEIKNLENYIEKLISLATAFEDKEEIKDIDFFQEIINIIDFNDTEKRKLIDYALINNLSNYKKRLNTEILEQKSNNQQEEAKEENIISKKKRKAKKAKKEISEEKIDELLEDMLNEVPKETNNGKKL